MIRFTGMKKQFLFTVMALISLLASAQEAAEQVTDQPGGFYFSDTTKWTMVYIFGGIVIWLVLRTFRDKADI